ncbi:MAG: hypothetical protein ACTSRP_19065 [Candidatus Helarchaeota archaeon]
MPFRIPTFLIKKIFPPDKSVSTIDTTGDGKADSIKITGYNIIQPVTIPKEINLGGIELEDFDLSEYCELFLDDMPINISKNKVNLDVIRNNFLVFIKDEKYTIDELLEGKAAGKLLGLGDTISILIKLDENIVNNLKEGYHTFKVKAKNLPDMEIKFELSKKNMNIKESL